MFTKVKTSSEIRAMRQSGRMLAQVLKYLGPKVIPGVSTKQLADLAAAELLSLGGKPAFLGYQGFPDVLCTSVNDEVVHGIPSRSKVLKNGDIIGLDFGVIYDGMTIAIEPMATLGGYEVYVDKDNWTIKTKDASLAAHFEHTVLIGVRDVSNIYTTFDN